MPSPVAVTKESEVIATEKKVQSMSEVNNAAVAAAGDDSPNVDPTDSVVGQTPSISRTIFSSLSNEHIFDLIQPLLSDSSITKDSSKEDLVAALTELLDNNKLTSEQFWEKALLNIPYTAIQGEEYAAIRLRKVHATGNKQKVNPKKSNAPLVLPPPAELPHYTKIEAFQILNNYKPVKVVMEQMIDQNLVPCQMTQLYALLKTDIAGGELFTPWKKEKPAAAPEEPKKIPEQPLVLPLPSKPPDYTIKEVAQLMNNLPAPTNPPFYTRTQTVNLLSLCGRYEKAMMTKLVEQHLVPVNLPQLRVLMKQAKSGDAKLDKPWNKRSNEEKKPKSKKRVADEKAGEEQPKQKRMKKSTVDDGEIKRPKKSASVSSVSKDFMKGANSLNDADFVRHVALEFKRRGYTFGLKLGTVKSDDKQSSETENGKGQAAVTGDGVESETLDQSQTKDGTKVGTSSTVEEKVPPPALPLDVLFYPSTVQSQTVNIQKWDDMYDQVKAFYDEHGHLQVVDTALSNWLSRQKYQWKEMQKEGTHHFMTMHKLEKLNAINFGELALNDHDVASSSNITDGQIKRKEKKERHWNQRLDELKAWVENNGTTVVPRLENDLLSKWCYKQRVHIKLFRDGDTTTFMTQEKIDKLDEIGFDTVGESKVVRQDQKRRSKSKSDVVWEENFNALLAYKERFGTCDVKEKKGIDDEWKKLAGWVGLQRTKYRKKMSGKSHGRSFPITDEQIKKLAGIGFNFAGKRLDFETRFKQLLEFVREHGHTRVPVFYAEHDNLGRWAKRMRDGIRNNEPWVDEIHKARLLGIGFDIAARQVFDHPVKKQPDFAVSGMPELTGFVNQDEPLSCRTTYADAHVSGV